MHISPHNDITSDFREVYDVTPCYFCSFSNDGLITKINATLLNDLGYEHDEVVDKLKFEQILTVGSKIFFQTHFYPIIKLHEKANEIFLSLRTKDNLELPVLLNVKLVRSDSAFEVHCGGLQISQRNRFEKEILEAKRVAEETLLKNEELVKLKASLEENQALLESKLRSLSQKTDEQRQMHVLLSHDLQEPLRKISIISDLLINSEVREVSKLTDHLSRMHNAAGKLRRLLVNLQQYVAMDNKTLSVSKINLQKIIAEAQTKIISDSNALQIEVSQNLPDVEVDHHMFVALFVELMTNSVKFRDPQKELLRISVSADKIVQNKYRKLENKYRYDEFIRIIYKDNGTGIDKRYFEVVFQMFRKAHDVVDGYGIGLAYCKKIIELHNGLIKVESKVNVGTTFTILIPLNNG